jgi:hypothetical protein
MVHDMQLVHLNDEAARSGSLGCAVCKTGQTDRTRIRHSTAAPTLRDRVSTASVARADSPSPGSRSPPHRIPVREEICSYD